MKSLHIEGVSKIPYVGRHLPILLFFYTFAPAIKNVNSHCSCYINSAGTKWAPQQSLWPCDTNSAGTKWAPQQSLWPWHILSWVQFQYLIAEQRSRAVKAHINWQPSQTASCVVSSVVVTGTAVTSDWPKCTVITSASCLQCCAEKCLSNNRQITSDLRCTQLWKYEAHLTV